MSADRAFVDLNLVIYAHDVTAGDKHAKAQDLMADLWRSRSGCVSVQVLQEFQLGCDVLYTEIQARTPAACGRVILSSSSCPRAGRWPRWRSRAAFAEKRTRESCGH